MLEIIIKIAVSFLVSLGLAVTMEAPRKFLIHISAIGALGRFIYIMFEADHSAVFATFVSTMIIALFSHILARIFKAPVTVFLIAGIIPLVPGMGMYRIVENFLDRDTSLAINATVETFLIAGAIALAIFVVDSFFKVFKIRLPRK